MSDVAIIMGSDSDWPVMEEAAKALDSFGISYTADVVSAHRMPEEMVEFAKNAASKGYKVIIAGAGGAAHLPGMVASLTTLPVIGVPGQLDVFVGLELDEFERSGADRMRAHLRCRHVARIDRRVARSEHRDQ